MGGYEARLLDDTDGWTRNTVRLAIRRGVGDRTEFLNPDSTWSSVQEGMLGPSPMGIELPRAAVEAIATAIAEWQGHTSHADTEARVLREWLSVERDRVDRALTPEPRP